MEITYIVTALAFAFPLIVVIGIALSLRYIRRKAKGPLPRGGVLAMWALIAAGCLIFFSFFVVSPSLGERRQVVDRIVKLPRAEISSVVIAPDPNPGSVSLVAAPLVITASNELDVIVDALHSAHEIMPNHPRARWSALIRLVASSGDRTFIVEQTGSAENGTLIFLDSNVTYGWHIADLRCDDFGVILRRIVNP